MVGGDVLANLVVLITGDATSAIAALGAVGTALGALSGIGAAMVGVGELLTAGLTVPIVGLGLAGLESFEQIQSGLVILEGQTAATGPALDALNEKFKNLYADVPQSSKEVATVLATVYDRVGQLGYNVEDVSHKLLDMARMTGTSTSQMADDVTKMFVGWKVSAADADAVLTHLYSAFDATHVPITQLTSDVDKNQLIFQAYGISLKDSIAIMATLDEAGINSNDVIRGMAYGWAGLEKAATSSAGPTKQMAPILDLVAAEATKTGVASNTAAGLMSNFFSGIKDGTISAGDAVTVFGGRFGTQIYEAITSGKLSIGDFNKMLDDMGINLDQRGKDTLTFGQRLEELRHKLEIALAPIGKSIVQDLENLIDVGQPIIDFVTRLTQGFSQLSPGVQTFILVIGGIAAALGPILVIVGEAIMWIAGLGATLATAAVGIISFASTLIAGLGFVVSVFGEVGFSVSAVSVALLGLGVPIGIVSTLLDPMVLAIVALGVALAAVAAIIIGTVVGAFLTLYATSSIFRDLLGGGLEYVINEFGKLGEVIGKVAGDLASGNWSKAFDDIATYIQGVVDRFNAIDWNSVWNRMVESLRQSISVIGTVIGSIRDKFFEWANQQDFEGLGQRIGEWIGKGIVAFVKGGVDIMQAIIDGISGKNQYAEDAGADVGKHYGTGIQDYFKSGQLQIDLKSIFGDATAFAVGIYSALKGQLDRIHIDWNQLFGDINTIFAAVGELLAKAFWNAIAPMFEQVIKAFTGLDIKLPRFDMNDAVADMQKTISSIDLRKAVSFTGEPEWSQWNSTIGDMTSLLSGALGQTKFNVDQGPAKAQIESFIQTVKNEKVEIDATMNPTDARAKYTTLIGDLEQEKVKVDAVLGDTSPMSQALAVAIAEAQAHKITVGMDVNTVEGQGQLATAVATYSNEYKFLLKLGIDPNSPYMQQLQSDIATAKGEQVPIKITANSTQFDIDLNSLLTARSLIIKANGDTTDIDQKIAKLVNSNLPGPTVTPKADTSQVSGTGAPWYQGFLNWLSGAKPMMSIGATADPAQSVVGTFVQKTDATQAQVGVTAVTDPATGKVTEWVTKTDNTTSIVKVDGDTSQATNKATNFTSTTNAMKAEIKIAADTSNAVLALGNITQAVMNRTYTMKINADVSGAVAGMNQVLQLAHEVMTVLPAVSAGKALVEDTHAFVEKEAADIKARGAEMVAYSSQLSSTIHSQMNELQSWAQGQGASLANYASQVRSTTQSTFASIQSWAQTQGAQLADYTNQVRSTTQSAFASIQSWAQQAAAALASFVSQTQSSVQSAMNNLHSWTTGMANTIKGEVDASVAAARAGLDIAQAAARSAATWAQNAQQSANTARSAQDAASSSSNWASTSAGSASYSAGQAANSANAAATAASNAAESAREAEASRVAAQQSADNTPKGKAAGGGLVTKPTVLLVGEAGPELIVPLKEITGRPALTGTVGDIGPNKEATGNGEIHYHVSVTTDSEDIQRQVFAALRELEQYHHL